MANPFAFLQSRRAYRELRLVSFCAFLFGIIYGLFSFYLPIFVENIVGNIALVGILLASVEVAGIIFDLPIGAFADRYGRRRTIMLGALCLAFSALLFEMWLSLIWLAIMLLVYGVVVEFVIIANDAELMAVSPRHRSGKFFGIYEAFHNFGYTLGPILGGVLLWALFQSLFIVLAGFCFLLFIFALFFMERREKKHGSILQATSAVIRKDHFFAGSIQEFRKIGSTGWMLSLFYFTFAFRWGAFALLEPIFALRAGIDPLWNGLIYGASTLPFIFLVHSRGI